MVYATLTRVGGVRGVEQITGIKQKSTEPLVGRWYSNCIHDGHMHALPNHINNFFQQVADDLRPLSDHQMLLY